MIIRKVTTQFIDIWVEQEIIFIIFKQNIAITLDVAKGIVKERLKISDGLKRPVLIDIRNLTLIDSASREYLVSDVATYLLNAGGILFDSSFKNYLAVIAGNIFIKIDKPKIPTQLFTDKEKALEWLQAYINVD